MAVFLTKAANESALLRPDDQWDADTRTLRRVVPFLALVALLTVAAGIWLLIRPPADGFSFQVFEGDGSAPQVAAAKFALERIVPVGSALRDDDRFFRLHGGACGIVPDAERFPNTAVCAYDHGFLVSAGWRYVIDYDPVTMRSKHTEMTFGLTGP